MRGEESFLYRTDKILRYAQDDKEQILPDHVLSDIFLQNLRNLDLPVRRLIIFENRDERARARSAVLFSI